MRGTNAGKLATCRRRNQFGTLRISILAVAFLALPYELLHSASFVFGGGGWRPGSISDDRSGRCLVVRNSGGGCALSSLEHKWAARKLDLASLADDRSQRRWERLSEAATGAVESDHVNLMERAANLLASDALHRFAPFIEPAEDSVQLCRQAAADKSRRTRDGMEAGLLGLFGEDARLFTGFYLGDSGSKTSARIKADGDDPLSYVRRAFWESENYLRSEDLASGVPIRREFVEEVRRNTTGTPDIADALNDNIVLARLEFLASARFGYFVRRVQHRLRLERSMGGDAPRDIADYLSRLGPAEQAELARVATLESMLAIETRATALVGDPQILLDMALERLGEPGRKKVKLSQNHVRMLIMEAAGFGALLSEAESSGATWYPFHYTEYGARTKDFSVLVDTSEEGA